MYYYNLVLALYEPLVDAETDQLPCPRQIISDALKHLQTLVRLYYLRHGYDAMDLFIVIPLVLLGFKCIDGIDEHSSGASLESLRSTLMLIAKGLYNQRQNHYLAEALFRVVRGRMRPQEASLLRDTVDLGDDEPEEKRAMVQAVRSHWPVSVARRGEDVILTNLVENYAHLNIEGQEETVKDAY